MKRKIVALLATVAAGAVLTFPSVTTAANDGPQPQAGRCKKIFCFPLTPTNDTPQPQIGKCKKIWCGP